MGRILSNHGGLVHRRDGYDALEPLPSSQAVTLSANGYKKKVSASATAGLASEHCASLTRQFASHLSGDEVLSMVSLCSGKMREW